LEVKTKYDPHKAFVQLGIAQESEKTLAVSESNKPIAAPDGYTLRRFVLGHTVAKSMEILTARTA
jgi:hypothetical protein